MALTQVGRAKGTTAQHAAYSGVACEITINTDDWSARVEDGSTLAGLIIGGHRANAQTGTSYTIASSDQGKLITFSNASAIAVTVPQAAVANNFPNGAGFWVRNLGAGTATLTPATSTINGAASLALPTGAQALIVSDGANYQAIVIFNSGQYFSTNVPAGSAVSLSSGVAANIASRSLGPGEWDVSGTVVFAPAGTTTTSDTQAAISQTSATIPTISDVAAVGHEGVALGAGLGRNLNTGTCRISLATTTTIYLVGKAVFAISTETAYGYIRAVRAQ